MFIVQAVTYQGALTYGGALLYGGGGCAPLHVVVDCATFVAEYKSSAGLEKKATASDGTKSEYSMDERDFSAGLPASARAQASVPSTAVMAAVKVIPNIAHCLK